MKEKNDNESIALLGCSLMALFCQALEVNYDESWADFYKYKSDLINFREMNQRKSENLSLLNKKIEEYKLNLQYYIENKLYNNDNMNHELFLQNITTTHEMSISTMKDLIGDLSFTKNEDDYFRLRGIYQRLIRLANSYIDTVNLYVKNNGVLNKVAKLRGINLQEKCLLTFLAKQDLTPSGKCSQHIIIDENMDKLLDYLLSDDRLNILPEKIGGIL